MLLECKTSVTYDTWIIHVCADFRWYNKSVAKIKHISVDYEKEKTKLTSLDPYQNQAETWRMV